MSWFNRSVLAKISPALAINVARWGRERQQAVNQLKAFYEAGEGSPLHRVRRVGSGDETVRRAGTKLRDYSRWMDENYDVASGALDVLVNNTVGPLIFPEPLVQLEDGSPAQDVNDTLMQLFDDWIHACEVTGQLDYGSATRLVARSMYRDGEAFGRRIVGPAPGLKHGTVVPFSIECFESDFVPLDYEDAAKRVRQGIAVDSWGRPTRYYLHKRHPGDSGGTLSFGLGDELRSIDAVDVMHLKMVKRLHQLRGVSVFAAVLNRFDDLKEIDENERVASRVAAAMSAFIKKGTPDLYDGDPVTVDGSIPVSGQKRQIQFEPGMVFDDLLPGEDVGTIASNRPNNELIPFRDAQLRSAASALMVSYSSLSKNYDGTYSAQRQELVEQFIMYRSLTSMIVFRWCQPVWDGFVRGALLSGELDLAGVDAKTMYNVSHTGPAMPWIDPLKELEAAVIAESNLYESKSSIIRKRNGVPSQVYREIQRDRQTLDAADLSERDAQPTRREEEQQPQQPTQSRTRVIRSAFRSVAHTRK